MTLFLSVVFGLVSMAGYALANVHSKPLAGALGPERMLFLRSFTACGILAVASVPTLHRLDEHWLAAILTVALGLAGYLPVLAFTHGIRVGRLGVVSPIAATSPLVTVVLSFLFLDIGINALQWIAIVAVVSANVAACVDFGNWRNSNVLNRMSGVPHAVVASIGWGLFFFLLVPATDSLGPYMSALFAELGVMISAGIHTRMAHNSWHLRSAARPAVAINGTLIVAGTLAFTIGVERYNVAVVAALSNSVALLTAVLAFFVFNERMHRREIVAAAIMVAGVAAIPLVGA